MRMLFGAGELDMRVAAQRYTSSSSPSGELVLVWATIGAVRSARMTPTSGMERYGSEQLEAKEQVEFVLRWALDLADLRPIDRIIEPASDALIDPIPERSIYDIFAVLELGRHEGLRVLSTRRS